MHLRSIFLLAIVAAVHALDTTPPTVAISVPAHTNATVIDFTITADEAIQGLTAGSFTITGGGSPALSGSGASYTLSVTTAGDGPVIATLPVGAVSDLAGNPTTVLSSASTQSDRTAPVLTITAPARTNLNPVVFTVAATETIIGLAADDVILTGGSGAVVSGSGSSWQITVVPAADGTVTLALRGGAVTDLAGNGTPATPTTSTIYDSVIPVLSFSPASGSTVTSAVFTIDVSCSEDYVGMTTSDFVVTNGTALSLGAPDAGGVRVLTVQATTAGAVGISVASNAIQDPAGNGNAPQSASYTFTPTAISASITSPVSSWNASPISLTLTTGASVTGIDTSDVTVTGGTLVDVNGSGTSYLITVNPTSEGTITVNLAAGAGHTAIGALTAAASRSVTYDITSPAATITPSVHTASEGAFVPFTVVFSEPVSGLTLGAFDGGIGTLWQLSGSGTTYTVTVKADGGSGTLNLTLLDTGVSDAAGNGCTTATSAAVTISAADGGGGGGGGGGGAPGGGGGGCGAGGAAGLLMAIGFSLALRGRRR